MKKIRNSKRGFTLTEILIVTGIIVILSAAAFVGVAVTIQRARTTRDNLNKTHGGDNFELAARATIEAYNVVDYVENPTYVPEGASPTPTPADGASLTPTPPEYVEPVDPSPTTKPTSSPTPQPTKVPVTNTPIPSKAPANTPTTGGGGSSGSGSSTVVGFAEATNGYVGYYNNGKYGVMSITDNGDNSIKVVLTDGWNNNNPSQDTCTVTIKKNGDNYTLSVDSGGGWIVKNATMTDGDWTSGYNYSSNYPLTQNDLKNLESRTGLKLS